MTVFCDVATRNLSEIHQRFRGTYTFHCQDEIAVIMEAVNAPETSVNFYEVVRQNFPKTDFFFRGICLKSYRVFSFTYMHT
jgi:hypothetical protein